MPDLDADVCVVGAGYAGLTTAVQAGRSGPVGGRARSARPGRRPHLDRNRLAGGTPDRPRRRVARRRATTRSSGWPASSASTTYKTWVKGAHLLVDGDRIRRYTGLIPKISPLAVLTIALGAAARRPASRSRFPSTQPWTAGTRAGVGRADRRSAGCSTPGIRTAIGRDLFEMAVRGLFTGDLDDTSFLHLLFLVRAHGSINTLFSIENGAQENLVDGGAGSIARKIGGVGSATRCGSARRCGSITQRDDHVVVAGDGLDRCRANRTSW